MKRNAIEQQHSCGKTRSVLRSKLAAEHKSSPRERFPRKNIDTDGLLQRARVLGHKVVRQVAGTAVSAGTVQRMRFEEFEGKVKEKYAGETRGFYEFFEQQYLDEEKRGGFGRSGLLYGWDWTRYVEDLEPEDVETYIEEFDVELERLAEIERVRGQEVSLELEEEPQVDPHGLEVINSVAADAFLDSIVNELKQKGGLGIVRNSYSERALQLVLNSVGLRFRENRWGDLIDVAEVFGQDVPFLTYQNVIDTLENIEPSIHRRLEEWNSIASVPLENYSFEEAQGILYNKIWSELQEEKADARFAPNELQRFGVEIELNLTKIPYGNKGSGFRDFAVTKGHLGFMRHKSLPVVLHLDHLDTRHAKLEVVGYPPQPLEKFVRLLGAIRERVLGKKIDSSFLENFTWLPGVPPVVKKYIQKKLTGQTGIKGQPVQVTTTHTAKELKQILPNTHEGFRNSRKRVGMVSKDIKIDKLKELDDDELDDFIVKEYLGNIKTLAEGRGDGKGPSALIKHAAEQFVRGRGFKLRVPDDLPVDRIKTGTRYLNQLHTTANKLAPVFKRGGDVAYVVEYRSGSQIAPAVNNFLTGQMEKGQLIQFLQKYQPSQ